MASISEISPYGPDCFFENVEGQNSFINSSQLICSTKTGQVHDKALVFTVSLIKQISFNFFVSSKAAKILFPTISSSYIGIAILAQSVFTYFFYKHRFQNEQSSFLTQISEKVSLICSLTAKGKICWAVKEVFRGLALDIGSNFALNLLPIYPKYVVSLLIFAADALKVMALFHLIFSKVEGKFYDFI